MTSKSKDFDQELADLRARLNLNARELMKSNSYGYRICAAQLVVAFFAVFALQGLNLNIVIHTLISAVVLGIIAYRVQFILHDASHKTLFKNQRVNELAGWIFGIMVGVNFSRYRFTHMWHHRLTGSENDPQYRDYLHGQVSRGRFVAFILSPLVGSRLFPYLGREFLQKRDLQSDEYQGPKVSQFWYACAILVVVAEIFIFSEFGQSPQISVGFLMGLPTISLFLARLRAVAEHQDFTADRPGFTRSHRFNLIDFFFLYDANFNYHFEHHLYPGISSRHYKTLCAQLDALGRPADTMGTSMFATIIRGARK